MIPVIFILTAGQPTACLLPIRLTGSLRQVVPIGTPNIGPMYRPGGMLDAGGRQRQASRARELTDRSRVEAHDGAGFTQAIAFADEGAGERLPLVGHGPDDGRATTARLGRAAAVPSPGTTVSTVCICVRGIASASVALTPLKMRMIFTPASLSWCSSSRGVYNGLNVCGNAAVAFQPVPFYHGHDACLSVWRGNVTVNPSRPSGRPARPCERWRALRSAAHGPGL